MDWKKGKLSNSLAKALHQTLMQIQNTIKTGPVKYAEQGQMFSYESTTKSILIDSDLWDELCLTGYWIKDSLLLRWAELCEQFSFKYFPAVTKGLVLDVLLQVPEVAREQKLARDIYLRLPDLQCVWSEKYIKSNSLEVDHALPYSLWHNNQLWNLLPAHKTINNQKSNFIPSPEFLKTRREAIVYCWSQLRSNEQEVFEYEVDRTLGGFNNKTWEEQLFVHMKSKAEQGIYTRGVKPWSVNVNRGG